MLDLQQRLSGPEAKTLMQPGRTLLLEANVMLMDQQRTRLVRSPFRDYPILLTSCATPA